MRESRLLSIILATLLLTVIAGMFVNYRLVPRQNAERPKIAVIKIGGEINQKLVDNVLANLEEIDNNEFYKGVILEIDSYGGGLYPSYLLAQTILELRNRKYVVVNIKSIALSAAYIIASSADLIISSDISRIGDIGIFIKLYPVSDSEIYVISNDLKVVFKNDYKGLKEWKEMTQKNMKLMFKKVQKLISDGRRLDISQVEKISEKALVYTPGKAKELGLIDEIMPNNSRFNVVHRLLEELNLPAAEVVEFKMNIG